MKKHVFGFCDHVTLVMACLANNRNYIEIFDLASIGIILSRQLTRKMLLRLRGCAGWSVFVVRHKTSFLMITSHNMTKQTKWLCAQQRLRSVWAPAQSSLCTQWVAKDPSFLHADSKDWSDWTDAQAESSLGTHSFCRFCHVVVHIWSIFNHFAGLYRLTLHINLKGHERVIFCVIEASDSAIYHYFWSCLEICFKSRRDGFLNNGNMLFQKSQHQILFWKDVLQLS